MHESKYVSRGEVSDGPADAEQQTAGAHRRLDATQAWEWPRQAEEAMSRLRFKTARLLSKQRQQSTKKD